MVKKAEKERTNDAERQQEDKQRLNEDSVVEREREREKANRTTMCVEFAF